MKKLVRLAGKIGFGRVVCLVLLAGLVVLRIWDPLPLRVVRLGTFDFYQRLVPFHPQIHPVVIVDIDEQSSEGLRAVALAAYAAGGAGHEADQARGGRDWV